MFNHSKRNSKFLSFGQGKAIGFALGALGCIAPNISSALEISDHNGSEPNLVGQPGNLGGSLGTALRGLDEFARLRRAYQEIKEDGSIKGSLADPNLSALTVSQRVVGPTQLETTKFQHYYKGLEVMGSMAFHHSGNNGTSIRNRIARFDVSTEPTLSAETAVALAKGIVGDLELKGPPTLRILPSHNEGSAKLIYWVELKGKSLDGARDLIIDAHSGKLVGDLTHDFSLAPVQVYSAQKQGKKVTPNLVKNPITGKTEVKNCKLTDLKKGTSQSISASACIAIYQGNSSLTQSQCQTLDGLEGFPLDVRAEFCTSVVKNSRVVDSSDPAVLRASNNSSQVLKYYQSRLGRNSFDNRGSDLVSVIHAGEKMANAFWMTDLNTMVYGDGDGQSMGDLTLSVDVAGHEMTHGVTTKTADLMMMGESGALNEAFSDFFGKLIEGKNDWVMGRKLFLGPNARKGLRDLANPGSLTDHVLDEDGLPVEKPYPAHVSEAAGAGSGDSCSGSNDRCWVHFNSTIPGHASYLIHQSLGAKKAEVLLYTALTQNMSSTDDFKSAAQAVLNTCEQLSYSSLECGAVKKAYQQVGVL